MARLSLPVSDRDHAQGNADAPCTLLEYGDFQCPDCRRLEPLVKELRQHFGERLRLVFRNFPMTQLHKHAQAAAEVAEFAASQGRFWEMHDLLLENQKLFSEEIFAGLAAQLGLDPGEAAEALAKKSFAERVREDFISGVRSGVNGTPTFYINGERYNGMLDFERLSGAIEGLLQG
jgi:protein-disulfide isomerase